jgi:hypothetical protein
MTCVRTHIVRLAVLLGLVLSERDEPDAATVNLQNRGRPSPAGL